MDFLRKAGLGACMLMLTCANVRAQSRPDATQETSAQASVVRDSIRSSAAGSVVMRPLNSSMMLTKPILPAGAATAHYGFFCRQELKWDKKLPTQLRFRVGSYDACDRLEGKRRD